MSLPQEKIVKIEKECKHLLRKCMVSIREFAKVIGILVSSCLGVRFGQLHTRYLEIYKTQQLRRLQSYDANVYLSKNVRSELHWWVTMVKQQNGRIITNILGLNEWQFEIFTDARGLGLGMSSFFGRCFYIYFNFGSVLQNSPMRQKLFEILTSLPFP